MMGPFESIQRFHFTETVLSRNQWALGVMSPHKDAISEKEKYDNGAHYFSLES